MWESWVQSLAWEDPLEEGVTTHSSILAWRIAWTEEPGGVQSMGSPRVRHDWVTKHASPRKLSCNPYRGLWSFPLVFGTQTFSVESVLAIVPIMPPSPRFAPWCCHRRFARLPAPWGGEGGRGVLSSPGSGLSHLMPGGLWQDCWVFQVHSLFSLATPSYLSLSLSTMLPPPPTNCPKPLWLKSWHSWEHCLLLLSSQLYQSNRSSASRQIQKTGILNGNFWYPFGI